jgi:predicted pyridoxine 5'-phosphate oxidase superfamily flavin-nucleotide-binding protein
MLTPEMCHLIRNHTLGFVATIDATGHPRVSPKATTVIVDATTLVMSNLRSPGTVANIALDPRVELNFIDVLKRKACRLDGVAKYRARDESAEINARLAELFAPWGDLRARMQGFFEIEVRAASIVLSPAYDDGALENDLEREWLGKLSALVD